MTVSASNPIPATPGSGRPAPLRTIHSFDGLRGWAALGIVVYHCRPTGRANPLLDHLSVGVDLFFVLSGFVMSLTSRTLFADRIAPGALRVFLARRLARIYPLYGLVTAVIALMVATGHSARASRAALPLLAPTNLLMVQTWFGLSSLDFAAWSISTEWAAYLAFPLLVALLLRPGRDTGGGTAIRAGAAAVAAIVVAIVYGSPFLSPITVGRGGDASLGAGLGALAQCLGDFTLGMLAFVVAEHPLGRRVARQPAAGLLVLGLIVLLAFAPMRPLPLAILVLSFPVLLVAFSADHGPAARLFAGRVGRRLGAWSYAVYLIHPGLLGLDKHLGSLLLRHGVPAASWLATLGTIIVVLPVAALTHRWFEQPMRRLIRARTEATPAEPRAAVRV